MMRICPYGLFLLYRFLPGALVPSWFFFSPFLPGYWLRGDISCSFVYIGDHLQDLWQLLLFLCVCVRTVGWFSVRTVPHVNVLLMFVLGGEMDSTSSNSTILILLAVCFLYLLIMWTFYFNVIKIIFLWLLLCFIKYFVHSRFTKPFSPQI